MGSTFFLAYAPKQILRAVEIAVGPSDFHDPDFGKALRRAQAAGVEVRAFCFRPTLRGFYFDREVPVDLEPYDLTDHRKWSLRNERFSG